MKKRTLALMLSAALCVGLLAGCGSGNNDPVNTPAAGGSETPSQESTAALSGTVNTNGSTSMEKVIGTQDFIEMQIGGWDGCKNPDGSFEAELQIIIASTIANGFNKLAARGY